MRRMSLLFTVLIVIPMLGSDSPKEYDDRTETVGIEGTWRLTEYQFSGYQKETYPFRCVITFRRGAYWSDNGENGKFYPCPGTYRIDSTLKPSHLDLLPSKEPYKGQTLEWIYEIDRDTLRLAGTFTKRPQGFTNKRVLVVTYKRVR